MDAIEDVRRWVCARRAGLDDATDEAILTVWDALTAEAQDDYRKGTMDDADCDGPDGNV